MQDTLRQCEREVEQARSKLSHDLATLRAPETFASFTDDLKRDALETKDALVEQAKNAAQSKFTDLVDDLKAKAAANPAAALAIGAGIAWRLLRDPPIATALIGAGIYGLWRTNGYQPPGRSNAEYLERGKTRLMEQASDLAASTAAGAKDVAADVSDAVSAKATEIIETAKAKAQEWSGSAQSRAHEWSDDLSRRAAALGSALEAEAESLNAAAGDAVRSVSARAQSATSDASMRTSQFVRDTMNSGREALADPDSRDKLLLGVAGLAVAAALGIACQRRMTEQVE